MADYTTLHDIALALGSAGIGMLPGWFRNWRNDRDKLITDQAALATETKERGKLEQRLDELSSDFEQFADGTRKRFERNEKKEQALEQAVTGKMPRFSGEGPTNG
jgi:hypothetical protein